MSGPAPLRLSSSGPASLTGRVLAIQLERAAKRLGERLAELEARIAAGDVEAWALFAETVQALAAVLPAIEPARRDTLLTTRELADKLGVSSKTLLKRRRLRQMKPAFELGKRGRAALWWRPDEVLR